LGKFPECSPASPEKLNQKARVIFIPGKSHKESLRFFHTADLEKTHLHG